MNFLYRNLFCVIFTKNLKTEHMKTLFQSQDRQGFLVLIDTEQSNLESVLWDWLQDKHHEVYLDIELWEGGSIKLENYSDGKTIQFSGDNGIFKLEEVFTEEV